VDLTNESLERTSLAVPAEPERVAAIRGFLATVAAHYGVDADRIEDLQVAVTEICAAVGSVPGGRITVETALVGTGLEVTVSGAPPFEAGPDGDALTYRRQLIDALIPQARFTPSGDAMYVRFTVPLSD
jgi:hypothetical protein